MDAPVVVLAGVRAELQAPSPLLALALNRSKEEIEAMEMAELWALASIALLECWPLTSAWPILNRPRRWRIGENVAERGREVFDGLVSSGTVPTSALLGRPGEPGILASASAWATSCFLAKWEIDGARDFCVVPAAGSPAADSGSAASTASPPHGGTA